LVFSMPQGLTRHYGQGDLHFVSFSCYHRIPFLKSQRARNAFVEILGQVRDRYEFLLLGYVVMPDHVHLLISEPKKGTPSTVVQVLKQRSSRFVARQATAKERRAIHGRAVDAQAVLANAILRFQRLESREGAREAGLHARQSVEEPTGGPPTRLAVEQFLVLRDRRTGTPEDRCQALRNAESRTCPEKRRSKERAHPCKNRKDGPPAASPPRCLVER
jgi:REP element-mobilizing transposase RayT